MALATCNRKKKLPRWFFHPGALRRSRHVAPRLTRRRHHATCWYSENISSQLPPRFYYLGALSSFLFGSAIASISLLELFLISHSCEALSTVAIDFWRTLPRLHLFW
ncbi:hypothetical protein CsSME_00037310 [Camellia sinensis var. sinensis]